MKPSLLTNLLEKANGEELGFCVRTNNPRILVEQLEAHKRWLKEFKNLLICTPSIEGWVYIVQESVELDDDVL